MDYILFTLSIIISAVILYSLYRYEKRFYFQGYCAAQKYGMLIPIDKESLNNSKILIDKIFSDTSGEFILKKEEKLLATADKIFTLNNVIKNEILKKESLLMEIANIKDNSLYPKKYSEEENIIILEVENLDKKIESLEKELIEEKNKYAKELPRGEIATPIKTSPLIIRVANKIAKLSEEFYPLWFFLIIIIIDYFLATSFFIEMANSGNKFLDFVIGWTLPLGVTFISMLLIQMMKGDVRKIKNSQDIFDYFRSYMPLLLLITIFVMIIWLRVSTSSQKMMDVLLGILFISLVLVTSYYVEKNGKNVVSLITTPISLIILFIELILFSLLWVFENICIALTPRKKTSVEILFIKNIKDINKKIAIFRKEKRHKNYLLKQSIDNVFKLKNDDINTARKTIYERIDVLDKETADNQAELLKTKKEEKLLKKIIFDTHKGSSDGAMAILLKRSKIMN
jgi:hypothetical protein